MKISSLNMIHFNLSLNFKQELRQKIMSSEMKITAASFEGYKSEFHSNDALFLHPSL